MNDDQLKMWIGRQESTSDILTERIVDQFRAALAPHLAPMRGNAAPPLIHWCLGVTAVAESELGPDGHPKVGGFLPPVPLPRRMWASGELSFHDELRVGDEITRRSTIRAITRKTGRSGRLYFVDIDHVISTPRGAAIDERQTLVYREASTDVAPAPPADASIVDNGAPVDFSTVRLFRYSAVTFNGHRIHYDENYARQAEGYSGLVVHGPLQATILAHAAMTKHDRPITKFGFRGTAALIGPTRAFLSASEREEKTLLELTDNNGRKTMEAWASY